jgi:hypothetical protein
MLAVAYSHARQVKGDDPDKKGQRGPPGWGLGVRLTTPPHKIYCYETSRGGQDPPRAVELMMMMITMMMISLCYSMYILTAFRFCVQVNTTNYLINLNNVTSMYKSNILTVYPASNIFQT